MTRFSTPRINVARFNMARINMARFDMIRIDARQNGHHRFRTGANAPVAGCSL